MRIISGKYKGRNIMGYAIDGTRPTMDRVRESLFAMLGETVKDAHCLDLFAGSGALGLEALSNGGASCVFVDHNSKVITTLKENCQKLKVEESIRFLQKDYLTALNQLEREQEQFDLVFLDPPYQEHLLNSALQYLLESSLLSPKAVIVCESEGEVYTCSCSIWKERTYGSKVLRLYKITEGK